MSEPTLTEAEQDAMTDAAAHWCMRLNAADCTAGERKAFERWLGAHPLHAVEYQAVLEIWDISAQIPPVNPAPAVGSQPALAPADEPPKARRYRLWGVIIVLIVSVAVYLGWGPRS